MSILIEVAITSVAEAQAAVAASTDRLELCANLDVGGVTPAFETFRTIHESVQVPVWVLVRPRAGDFVYSAAEFDELKRDAKWFLENGAAGIVVGVLNPDRTIDATRNAALTELGRAVFHRAFDEVPDRMAGLKQLIELGFTRVLTSGGAATALEGADAIAELIRAAAGRIEVLPGGGVNAKNAAEIVRRTGCTQLHGSFRGGKSATDPEQIRETKCALTSVS